MSKEEFEKEPEEQMVACLTAKVRQRATRVYLARALLRLYQHHATAPPLVF
jgi:hypothetical protein